jgi:hypothetical protein
MTFATVAALLTAWALGVLAVSAFRPRGRAWRDDAGLVVTLGLLVGLGVTGSLFFLASLVSARPLWLAGALEMAAGGLLGGLLWRRRRDLVAPAPRPVAAVTWLQVVLLSLLVQVLLVAAVLAWRMYQAEPYGGWDAWAIWNLHARFMVRAGTDWPALAALPAVSWTHPDYPRLLPAAVARLWAWGGVETPAASAALSVAFAVGTLGVVMAAIGRVRGRTMALAAGLLLAGTPFFVTFTPNQHADIPLAGFIVAALALLAVGSVEGKNGGGWYALAGVCTGLAGGTKNEGLLLALVLAGVVGWGTWRAGEARRGRVFWAGLGAALVPVGVFKLWLAPPNDLMGATLLSRLAQLFDGSRHEAILMAFGRGMAGFGEWTFAPYVVMALPFAAWRARRRLAAGERVIPFTVGAMLVGYYGVYLLSPHDLAWHLNTSLVRLLLQMWPAVILWWGLAVPAEGETRAPVSRATTGWGLAVGVAVTLAAAGAITWALTQQRAPRELFVGRGAVTGVVVALGDGWYPEERHGRDRWAWSGGGAELRFQADKRVSVTLRFQLRAVTPRRVTVTWDGDVLWQGAVANDLVRVELRGLVLPGGATTLGFSTDAPGVAEAPGDGGRTLTYALYNVELR